MCGCSSRKGTEETASFLLSTGGSHSFVGSAAQRAALINAASQLENKHLCQAVQGGVAFHHGNLSANDRATVEMLFLNRAIEVGVTSLKPVHVMAFTPPSAVHSSSRLWVEWAASGSTGLPSA